MRSRYPSSILDPLRTLTGNIALELAYATGDHRQGAFLHRGGAPRNHHDSQLYRQFRDKEEGDQMRINPRIVDIDREGAASTCQAFFTVGILVVIVAIIFVKGFPHLEPRLHLLLPGGHGPPRRHLPRHRRHHPSRACCPSSSRRPSAWARPSTSRNTRRNRRSPRSSASASNRSPASRPSSTGFSASSSSSSS